MKTIELPTSGQVEVLRLYEANKGKGMTYSDLARLLKVTPQAARERAMKCIDHGWLADGKVTSEGRSWLGRLP